MPQDNRISKISVEALHDQFDIEMDLNPGLNIIYGKNGRGKTTILHLLANALELDFQRFSFLQFRKITIQNYNQETVEIAKEDSASTPKVLLNGALTSYSGTNDSLSQAEISGLRDALGGRPTYLPAFRSVLERTRADSSPYFRNPERRDSDYETMLEREYSALKESAPKNGRAVAFENRSLQEEANSTAQKTLLCRQWFGSFVPIIRYPSVADVEDALSEEWRNAQIDITRREQRMFEEIFVKVFRTISGLETTSNIQNNENLLASISDLLKDQESQLATTESSKIYDSLLQAARSIESTQAPLRGIDNSLLEMYREVLQTRNTERRNAFQRSRDFEASVNKFLDKKTLKIGHMAPRPRSRNVVAVSTEGGHSYGLSALSSGERQILTMLYSASRTKFLSGVFLIDEPELSLHIDWQRIVLRELHNQSPDRQIIACTHSPEVGADHVLETQDFEPKGTRLQQNSLFNDEEA